MFTFTVYDLLAKNLAQNAHHPALIWGEMEMSYSILGQQVEKVALFLHQHGVRRGERIGIYLPKSIEEIIVTFAIARLGAVFVNIHYQWTLRQLTYIVQDCGIKIIFTDKYKAAQIENSALWEQLDRLVVKDLVIKNKALAHSKLISWSDLPPSSNSSVLPSGPIDVDLAALFYTSGSTGSPKGVMLTHYNIVQGARSVASYLNNTSAERVLGLLSMSFDYGMNQVTTMFLVGGTVVLQPVVMLPEIVKTVMTHQVTGLAAVPPTWIQLVRYLQETKLKLPSLRYLTNSGGKIPQTILQAMPQVFPNVDIYLMYGLTEAFRSTYLPPTRFHEKMGAIGKAIPNTEVYVVDPQKGLCQPGEPGELLHRGSLISLGYWGQPELTQEKIKVSEHLKPLIGEEKVLFSGDIVKQDEEGILWFISRADALIKSNSIRISPTEVEDIVYESEMVNDAIAFGVEDELLGQVVHIAVSLLEDPIIDIQTLAHYCRQNMPNYMIPREIHCWKGLMPRTASGKIDRPHVINTCLGQS
ncbi:AMP-dependent synthetase/ligase [Thioploca ingrica]|uniref:AMP-dependent synthetase/ligase n=1 Tax=Thioploca ingrica TaxID=40754 RepID=A0A090BUE6_9GAMM|nr:AMP-dependent synthetase/ligase [Thioploca ingrica]